jgi:beta-galactosidase
VSSKGTNKKSVGISASGLVLNDERDGSARSLPLYAGSMHYFRHDRRAWAPALDAMKAMGLRLVDTYVPWGIHELAPGKYDFTGNRDLGAFLDEIHKRGMYAIVRPGPHINAELSYFGLPERIVWSSECQAKTPAGNPVVLPLIPTAFPVPSYASEAFFEASAEWLGAVTDIVAPLQYPNGPVVLLQVDNEGAMYFRDGPYDQDYHPDSIRLFRSFLRAKYTHVKELRDAWKDETLAFATANPPHRFDAKSLDDVTRHLDWMEYHEDMLAQSMQRLAEEMKADGLDRVPTFHNFPLGEAATALNPKRITEVLDFVGLDYYHPANPQHHLTIMRRTSELATRCEGRDAPAYGAEVGAGFPPIFAPLDEKDSLYTLMCALAYGLRGFNLYMAVNRDRWVGAPIDVHGMPTPFADEYKALLAALDQVDFPALHRMAPVRLVTTRAMRRLARAMHAFGPVTPALFNLLGAGAQESVLEDDLGTGDIPPIRAESFLREFERALLARGVPFAYAGGETLDASTKNAQWIIFATTGGIKPKLIAELRGAKKRGCEVTIGPDIPTRDGNMRPLDEPLDVKGLELEPLDDLPRIDALVSRRIEELSLPTFTASHKDVFVTVHADEAGAMRAAFVMNPTSGPLTAQVSIRGAQKLTDLVTRDTKAQKIVTPAQGSFAITLPPRTVRFFAVD